MIIGHQKIWHFLTQSAKREKLAHAYLFYGPPQVGKGTLALEFARWLLCENNVEGAKSETLPCGQCRSCSDIEKNQHPDVSVLRPRQEEKKGIIKTHEIGIDEVKNLLHQLSLSAYSASYKIAIIDGAEWLTIEAANAFLKTLEEPGARSLIILISSAWQSLLPTVISRCQTIKFRNVAESELVESIKGMVKEEKKLNNFVKMAAGRPGRLKQILEDPRLLSEQKENIEIFKKLLTADLIWRFDFAQKLSQDVSFAKEALAQWIFWLRQRVLQLSGADGLVFDAEDTNDKKAMLSVPRLLGLIKETQEARKILNNASLNARLILETLMLRI